MRGRFLQKTSSQCTTVGCRADRLPETRWKRGEAYTRPSKSAFVQVGHALRHTHVRFASPQAVGHRQLRCSDCPVGLITDISTAAKIKAKPTSELHMILSPQNKAENVMANRLSVHMMIEACEAGTWARPMFCMIWALIVAPRNR